MVLCCIASAAAGRIPTTALKGHRMEVTCTSSKNPRVVRLSDELVAEILARVPYRSLCQFKCVSRSWRSLCSQPAVLRRCPQSLTGFFFHPIPDGRHFVNASGRGLPKVNASLPFMPPGNSRAEVLDSCNGLLLCENVYSYFVCNPATEKWVDLPSIKVPMKTYCLRVFRLCFNPAVSSHFRVFTLESGWDRVAGVDIFSSETGAWSYRQSEWGDDAMVGYDSVFFNGALHLTSLGSNSLLTVDMDGKVWGRIPTPHDFIFIGVSQGRLLAVQTRHHRREDEPIIIWVLEDYAGQQWTLKHAVTPMQTFGARPTGFGDSYSLIVDAVHPEHGVIFLTIGEGEQRNLMSYDMEKKEVRFIWNLGSDNLSTHPYVPCFLDWLSDGH